MQIQNPTKYTLPWSSFPRRQVNQKASSIPNALHRTIAGKMDTLSTKAKTDLDQLSKSAKALTAAEAFGSNDAARSSLYRIAGTYQKQYLAYMEQHARDYTEVTTEISFFQDVLDDKIQVVDRDTISFEEYAKFTEKHTGGSLSLSGQDLLSQKDAKIAYALYGKDMIREKLTLLNEKKVRIESLAVGTGELFKNIFSGIEGWGKRWFGESFGSEKADAMIMPGKDAFVHADSKDFLKDLLAAVDAIKNHIDHFSETVNQFSRDHDRGEEADLTAKKVYA